VVRLGGLVASRVVNDWIDRSAALVVGIDRWGRVPDPARRLTHSLTATPAVVLDQLGAVDAAEPAAEWASSWRSAADTAGGILDEELVGEPAAIATAVGAAPDGASVVVSSSMPVRDLECFVAGRAALSFHANRGANGIDGVVSTAVGVAVSGRRTVAVVGDVAFLHDASALIGLASRGVTLAVVVLDNDGGGIFSFLPQAESLERGRFERLFGTPHGVDLLAMTRAHGLSVTGASSAAEVGSAISSWSRRGGVEVVVFRSDRAANLAEHRRVEQSVGRALAALPAIS
jgi:2-succinyl-5-enolpyruvyl-6-hydroxy-3-cyclohexene-1-carboxylate synthase